MYHLKANQLFAFMCNIRLQKAICISPLYVQYKCIGQCQIQSVHMIPLVCFLAHNHGGVDKNMTQGRVVSVDTRLSDVCLLMNWPSFMAPSHPILLCTGESLQNDLF